MKIKDYNFGDKATIILRFSDVQIKKTNSNADYASFLGFDGKDIVECKIWSLNEEKKGLLKSGEIYVATGIIKDYQGKMQFNINDFRQITEEDHVNHTDFYEYAPLELDVLQKSIIGYVEKIDNRILKEIVVIMLKKYYKDFFMFPAAMSVHHNYYSGLAYHVYSMLKLSDTYIELYKFVNKDLVYAGIILHDLGKLIELSGPKGTEYTKEGNLLGHITIASNEIYLEASKISIEKTEEIIALQHIIISHHGLLEYGSPKEPIIAEAALIYLLDYSDSRMAALEKEIQNVNKGESSNPILAFDRRSFYVPNIE